VVYNISIIAFKGIAFNRNGKKDFSGRKVVVSTAYRVIEAADIRTDFSR
jgi:hypothetical protein